MGRDLIVSKGKKLLSSSVNAGLVKNDSRKAYISALWNDHFAGNGTP